MHIIERRQNAGGMADGDKAGRRGTDPTARSYEELLAQRGFKTGQFLANGGLGDGEPPRSCGDGAGIDDGNEGVEPGHIHNHIL